MRFHLYKFKIVKHIYHLTHQDSYSLLGTPDWKMAMGDFREWMVIKFYFLIQALLQESEKSFCWYEYDLYTFLSVCYISV